jgi:uncharacterized protein (DUF2252 family)
MAKPRIVKRIERYNRGREAERLAIKYARMRASPFVFLRGTAHLFYEDWPKRSPLNASPKTWICGDLHLENFGGYRTANDTECFDISDFDEAALAPVTWELARLAVSLLLAADMTGMEKADAQALIGHCMDGYAAAMALPIIAPVDGKTPQPDLRRFLGALSAVHPDAFLKQRITGDKRRLRIMDDKTLAASEREKRQVKRWWKKQRRHPEIAPFGKLLDVARRITGTGSLGVHRYALLTASKDGSRLLEAKQAVPAAMIQQHRAPANPWPNEALRVVAVQHRAQRTPPLLLEAVRIGKRDYILRELHPGDDKLTVIAGKAQTLRLMRLAPWLGRVAAASHRHAAGWKGADAATTMAAFAKGTTWRKQVTAYAIGYKQVVLRDWAQFKQATQPKIRSAK